MTKKQEALGLALIDSMGNITQATAESECSLQDFHDWMKVDEFREMYDTAIQIRDDSALVSFMGLIDSGDRAATIEYQKMQRQREDISEAKRVKRETMRVLIESQDTKAACAKEYCQIFKCTKSAADDQFDNVVAEYGLKTPHQRMKEAKKIHEGSLSELFSQGKLTEIEMYSRMLEKALYDSENSEYPSERSKARADVININQRLDEINERIRREEEADNSNMFNRLDAVLAGTTPDNIAELKEDILGRQRALTEVN